MLYTWNESDMKYQGSMPRQVDPLESAKAGHTVYCGMPRNATEIVPPEEKDGFDIVWSGTGWEYKEIPQPEPEPEPTPEQIKELQIFELKTQLNSTDYKIIKCSECSLAGVELPYDIAALHAQRQAIRDEINKLEQQ